jgi:hypothetical protein
MQIERLPETRTDREPRRQDLRGRKPAGKAPATNDAATAAATKKPAPDGAEHRIDVTA